MIRPEVGGFRSPGIKLIPVRRNDEFVTGMVLNRKENKAHA
jgi:hypothetical protein